MSAETLQLIIPVAGIAAVLFAIYLARDVLSRDKGPQAMQDVADTIREGADAFIKRQYTTIGILAIVGAFVIGGVITAFEGKDVADTSIFGIDLGWRTGIAFLVGAACSMASGIIGMYISVRSNVRTASAAQRSLVEAVQVAMRGGAVSGFLVVALSLLGVYGIFAAFGGLAGGQSTHDAPFLIVGFGFGASFVALFAQLGGGIYTKAADVGSDLVGKVEAGIPEDDPRNAAVIADLVGDNVGDCAGRGADLFESTAAENIGAMILGVGAFAIAQSLNWPNPQAWIFFPLVVRGFGLLATIVAIFFVRGREDENPMNMLNRGYWVTTLLSVAGLALTTNVMMDTSGTVSNGLPTWVWFFGAGVVGLATSVAFVYITQYYTAGTFRPVREIAEASKTGPATNIISGTAVGFETTFVTAITIGIALWASHFLGTQAHLLNAEGHDVGGIFGTAVATMGMLMTTAYILAMDTFGPITDNAGGVAEFSRAEAGAREITDRLDAVGNTTKALTKGYAIASASLAAFLLFSAYIDKVNLIIGRQIEAGTNGARQLLTSVNLANVDVFIAALIGAMLVYFFSSLAIRAVGTTAQSIIVEVRRQFREMPGIMDYTQRPDYARVVDITTRAALKQMILPGVVAVATPIIVGLLLGHEAVAGMLMVGTIAGVLLATVLNNGGGAWDNAKKYIESGHLLDDAGNVLGKKTPAHAAAVVGDTVGDPFKDTAGPSLHVLVKLLATITLVLAPLFIR
ncbi:MAG TPA: sodium-translocating pyrophosphatase [Candidatus Polarisedimenticolia bacterium]|nr:sodium-translocating pyrophosphatase [Candidatus Polarisedimenticolia bacterium]